MKPHDLVNNAAWDMRFTFLFLKAFLWGIYAASPILLFLFIAIVLLGQFVGRHESWQRYDTLYWSFITATTVGYGEIRPARRTSKAITILIALLGLIFGGIIVAIAVKAVDYAFDAEMALKGVKSFALP